MTKLADAVVETVKLTPASLDMNASRVLFHHIQLTQLASCPLQKPFQRVEKQIRRCQK